MAAWNKIFQKEKDPAYIPIIAPTCYTVSSNYAISGFRMPDNVIKCEYCSTEYKDTTERTHCVSCGAPLKRTQKRVIIPPPPESSGILFVREVLK
jgi:hypothetical protein